MSAAAIVSRLERGGAPGFGVEGVLSFDSVAALAEEGGRLLVGSSSGSGTLEVDLGGVREANSAGLALLLEWMDMARRRKLRLRFRNPPASLVRLAALTNLSGLLGADFAGA